MKFVNSVLKTMFGSEDLICAAELDKEDPENAEEVIKSNVLSEEEKKKLATQEYSKNIKNDK